MRKLLLPLILVSIVLISGCIGGTTQQDTQEEQLTFNCPEGLDSYLTDLVLERYNANPRTAVWLSETTDAEGLKVSPYLEWEFEDWKLLRAVYNSDGTYKEAVEYVMFVEFECKSEYESGKTNWLFCKDMWGDTGNRIALQKGDKIITVDSLEFIDKETETVTQVISCTCVTDNCIEVEPETEEYVCPEDETIDCMPPVPESMQEYCSGEYHDWITANCDTEFTY